MGKITHTVSGGPAAGAAERAATFYFAKLIASLQTTSAQGKTADGSRSVAVN
jgi:hypothetical protein